MKSVREPRARWVQGHLSQGWGALHTPTVPAPGAEGVCGAPMSHLARNVGSAAFLDGVIRAYATVGPGSAFAATGSGAATRATTASRSPHQVVQRRVASSGYLQPNRETLGAGRRTGRGQRRYLAWGQGLRQGLSTDRYGVSPDTSGVALTSVFGLARTPPDG